MTNASVSPPTDGKARRIRVMVVDDAVVVRGLVSRWLGEDGAFEVVSTNRSGADAIAALDRCEPDVIVLDVEMPDMDGLTALPHILKLRPFVSVLMASALIAAQGDLALRCLSQGATDFIGKPSTNREVTTSADFRRDLIERVRVLGLRAQRRLAGLRPRPYPKDQPPPPPPLPRVARTPRRPTMLVIGASTGGPNAITALLGAMPAVLRRLPVVIAQHMPATFTPIFAEHLRRVAGVPAAEAVDGEIIVPGRIYLAPGGRHLRIASGRGASRAELDDGPPVNFCKPSVDVLFHSAAAHGGGSVVGVVLTGMGSDGLEGSRAIAEVGGAIFAQDEASSVVWGMPGAVFRSGICRAVGSATDIGTMLTQFVGLEPLP